VTLQVADSAVFKTAFRAGLAATYDVSSVDVTIGEVTESGRRRLAGDNPTPTPTPASATSGGGADDESGNQNGDGTGTQSDGGNADGDSSTTGGIRIGFTIQAASAAVADRLKDVTVSTSDLQTKVKAEFTGNESDLMGLTVESVAKATQLYGATEGCADKPSPYMQKNNRVCAEWGGLTEALCEGTYWAEKKFCQQSCFDIGSGYQGDDCPVKVIELVCGDLQWSDCKAQSPECNWSDGECHDTVVCGDLKWSSCQAAGECNWKGSKKKCVVSCGDLKWSTCQPSDPHSNKCEWSGTCNSPVSGVHPGCQLITKRWQCNKALCNWTPMCMRKTSELCDNLRFRACKANANCDWSGRKCWPVPDKDCVLGAEVGPADCTADCGIVTQSVTEAATGLGGTCSPGAYDCVPGEGSCPQP